MSGGTALAEVAPKIINNTIARNGGAGISHNTNFDAGFTIQNNLIVANQQGIAARSYFSGATNSSLTPNDVWNNGADNWINYPSGFATLVMTNRNGTVADLMGNICRSSVQQRDRLPSTANFSGG